MLALVLPVPVADGAPAPRAPDPLRLADDGSGVRALDVPLDGDRTVRAADFSMLALTWRGGSRDVRVRTRADGAWSGWRDLETLTDGPDRRSFERGSGFEGVVGTDLLWVGRSDAVRVDVAGAAPDDLTLVLMAADGTPAPAERTAARRKVLSPDLLRRRDWGADPSLRSGRPTMVRTVKQVHVHHTVNSNDYRRADVPGLLRGMYRYHTQSLGWSDLGYNFLVDRFGRTWVGRAGSAGKPVQGAHTLGFNHASTGVAVIGNLETRRPNAKVLTALVHLAAWKLDQYDRDPSGNSVVRSTGSDRFPAGRKVRLPRIDGHRDTNETACPGIKLYRRLDDIRRRATARIERRRS